MLAREEYIKKYLSGWSPEAANREYDRIAAGDHYEECPFKATGFRLIHLRELGSFLIEPDGKCICTKDQRCRNVDRRDGNRCTLEELRKLDEEAQRRRAWQSGSDW